MENPIKFKDRAVFITGADGGIGRALVAECIHRGAKTVYAAGINTDGLASLVATHDKKVVPIVLDVGNANAVRECAELCGDTSILINNAGIEQKCNILSPGAIDAARLEMQVNFHGTHNLCAYFTPYLKIADSACILNILSLASLMIVPGINTYCASKTACHMLTESLRFELRNTRILISGAYPGYIDTRMVEEIIADKVSPAYAARMILAAVEAGTTHIFPDPMSQRFSDGLTIKTPVLTL